MEKGAYTEYTLRDAQKYHPKETKKTPFNELIKLSGLSEKDCNKIYSDYLQHAYPSQFFNPVSFADYFNKLGLAYKEKELLNLYRAFSFNQTNYMSFHELLLGIAAMEKSTPHSGKCAELRYGYIFRYYQIKSNNDFLDRQEMSELTTDLLKLKGITKFDAKLVEEELKKNYVSLQLQVGEPVTSSALTQWLGKTNYSASLF